MIPKVDNVSNKYYRSLGENNGKIVDVLNNIFAIKLFSSKKTENIYLKMAIDRYIENYTNNVEYSYHFYTIVNIFRIPDFFLNTEGIYMINNKKYQILKNIYCTFISDEHSVYNNIKVFNNRYKNYCHHYHTFRD
jgi:hypothetical protein